MEPENIVLAASAALAVGLILWRVYSIAPDNTVAVSSLANPSEIPDSYETALSAGPSYYVASAPYYFAPPVSNVMPQASASRTIPYGDGDAGCGCG